MGTKAREANATAVVDADELGRLSTDKRAARKFINKYDFFLADTQIMPTVGKSLGQLLGPRGKMPTPVPFNAPIEAFLQRFKKIHTSACKGITFHIIKDWQSKHG